MSALVLIVDDNPTNLKLARVILASAGYDVATAVDAEDALAKLETMTPALVLMDLAMPKMDGLTLTRHIRAQPRWRDLRIVALTASAMKGDDQRALDAGCDGYITKPIDPLGLPKTVAAFIAG